MKKVNQKAVRDQMFDFFGLSELESKQTIFKKFQYHMKENHPDKIGHLDLTDEQKAKRGELAVRYIKAYSFIREYKREKGEWED